MKRLLFTTLILLLICMVGFSFATNHYIRTGASGSNDGSDWTNAWPTFAAATWARGDTFYVAGGTYAELVNLTTGEAGNTKIFIYKATDSEHGTNTGWDGAYADSVAIIAPTSSAAWNDCITFQTGYWTVDGKYCISDTLGYGFLLKIYMNYATGDTAWNGVRFYSIDAEQKNNVVRYCDFEGSKFNATDHMWSDIGVYFSSATKHATQDTIDHCYFHDMMREAISITSASHNVFQYCIFQRSKSGRADWHGQPIQQATGGANSNIFRYNKFIDCHGSCCIACLGSGAVSHDSLEIYGNVLYNTPAWEDTVVYSNSVFGTLYATPTAKYWKIYHNTFYKIIGADIYFPNGADTTGTVARNNLWLQCTETNGDSLANDDFDIDYNSYWESGTQAGESNSVLEPSEPVVDASAFNFELVAGASALAAGASLGAPYNMDIEGETFPDPPDIGAYDYNAPTGWSHTISTKAGATYSKIMGVAKTAIEKISAVGK